MRVSQPPTITLTTDFGLADGYVAAMKGVILSIAPTAQIIDVTHSLVPQNIGGAGFVLNSVVPFFESNTVHVAVVDPGVGTDRLPLAIQTPHGFLVGPNNGLFTAPLVALGYLDPTTDSLRGARVVQIVNQSMVRETISRTFHGRDVFAPAAAHLASGVPLAELGPDLQQIVTLQMAEARRSNGEIDGKVVHIDHFGNAISNIRADMVPDSAKIEVAGTVIDGLSKTYQDREFSALTGSTGYIELAVRNGSAADVYGLRVGDRIHVWSGQ